MLVRVQGQDYPDRILNCKLNVWKEFCKKRGYSAKWKRKKELMALAWALSFEKASSLYKKKKKQEREAVNLDYKSLLEVNVDMC